MTQAEIICPRISSLEEVRIFIAEDSESKREKIFASLGAVGIGTDAIVEVAEDYARAEAFIGRQEPGDLEANVLMLDGALDDKAPLNQGSSLVNKMFEKYLLPINGILFEAQQNLSMVLGGRLSKTAIDAMVSRDKAFEQAYALLRQDVLMMGISRVNDGGLPRQIAQIPWVDNRDRIGELTLTSLLGEKGFKKHMNHRENMKNPQYVAAQARKEANQ